MKKLLTVLGLVLLLASITGCGPMDWEVERDRKYKLFSEAREDYYNENYAAALRKFTSLAAEQGHPTADKAQNFLGVMYHNGEGVARNYKTAMQWYIRAAEKRNTWAKINLGLMYEKGQGVIQNFEEAVKWYTRATEGFTREAADQAQNRIDHLRREADTWAEQGNAEAQYFLGQMYRHGKGVTENDKTAVQWYTRAAEQGHDSAQYALGKAYRDGLGVLQDNTHAYIWLNIAAANGIESAISPRDILKQQMSPDEILEANKLSRDCVKKEYKGCGF